MHIEPYAIAAFNAHYDGAYADSELEWRRIGAFDKANNLDALLGDTPISSVLEVGCGTGSVLAEVARRGIGARHVGIDIADPHEHLDPRAQGLDLRHYDGGRLPFESGSFDFVFASHVVEHVPNPRGLLAELQRVSAGYVYVEVPCEITIRSRRPAIQTALQIGHINAYTPDYFMVLLQPAGMKVADFRVFDHSLEMHSFGTSRRKGRTMQAIRGSLLKINPVIATRLFCYHVGALIDCQD